jgi:antitoxin CptB
LDIRRRKLLFRAWHRGLREVDLILGRFADGHIEELDEADLSEFENLMTSPTANSCMADRRGRCRRRARWPLFRRPARFQASQRDA